MCVAFHPFCLRNKARSLQFVYEDAAGFLFWCQKCARVFETGPQEARRVLAEADPTCPFNARCPEPRVLRAN